MSIFAGILNREPKKICHRGERNMYLVVGLGNPGKKYEKTRHNMGFMVIDRLAEMTGTAVDRLKFRALTGECLIGGERVMLMKPQTFMNLSGDAVREAAGFFKLAPSHIIVIYDDIDIPLGNLRLRKSGSAGTHNGMRSIVSLLGTDQFPRVRVGIGGASGDLVNHVIGKISPGEIEILDETVKNAADAVECFVKDGIDIAMNRFNTRKHKDEEK